MSNEKIVNLPKWVQDHICDLQEQRDVAVHLLNEYIDTQTPSAIYMDEFVSIGHEPFKRRYVRGHRLSVNHAGVRLSILLRDKTTGDEPHIDLQWYDTEQDSAHVALIPTSFQKVSLISKGNMR